MDLETLSSHPSGSSDMVQAEDDDDVKGVTDKSEGDGGSFDFLPHNDAGLTDRPRNKSQG